MPDKFGEHLRRSETIPSSIITPDPSDFWLHAGVSSLKFFPLIAYMVQVRDWNGGGKSLVLIHDAMYLKKMSRLSGRKKIGTQY